MSEVEIDLARDYLAATEQDAVAALIWAVKDLAYARRVEASRPREFWVSDRDGWIPARHSTLLDHDLAEAVLD